jgi:alpha-L-rhamnosidase
MTSMADGHILEFGLGDWCAPGEGFGKARCPTAVTSTGYYYANARTLWRIAAVLGKTTDAKKYSRLAEQIRDAFLARFYGESTGQIAGGSQTAQGCGLFMGLVPADQRGKVADALIAEIASCKGHLDFGILGAKYVLNALTDCDRAEAAYALVARDDYPGWGHWIRQGATTLWETWEGAASRNHHMFSDVSAWFYKTLAGINLDPDSPGFKHVILRPHPVADLTWVRAEHRSMYGPIRVAWTRAEGKFTLRIHLPPNTTATVHVPTGDPASVTEGGKCVPKVKDVEFVGTDAGRAVFNVGAGDYEFVSSL